MGEKVYCDECIFLQNRQIKVNDEVTGTMFYCPKKKYWFSIGSTLELVGFSCCAEGVKK